MTNLNEELKKTYDFVNSEFDINDNNAIEAIKEGIELEKLEELNIMIKTYKKALKKALNAEKRKQKQKDAQKNYKNIQTNVKIEDFIEIEDFAIAENLTVSELLKKSVSAFISPKKPEAIQIPSENELSTLKGEYKALKLENEALIEQKATDAKKFEDFENMKQNLSSVEKEKNQYFQTMTSQKSEINELGKKLQKILVDNSNASDLKKENEKLKTDLEKKQLEMKKLQSMSIFEFLKSKFSH